MCDFAGLEVDEDEALENVVVEDEVPSTSSGQAHRFVHSPDISFSFFTRDQPFNCFSRATACSSV